MSHPTAHSNTDKSLHLWGLLYAFLGFSMFAFGDTGYKWLMQDYSFFMVLFAGSVLGVALMSVYIPFGGGLRIIKTSVPRLQAFRATLISCQFLLAIYSIQYLPLPIFYTIAFTAPAFSAILSALILKETVSVTNWLAIIVGLCGVFIALQPWDFFLNGAFEYNLLAIGCNFLASLLLSSSQICARIIGQKSNDSSFATAYYPIFLVFLLSGLIYFTSDVTDPVSALKPLDIAILCGVALTGVLGNVFLALGFAKAPPALAAPFHYTQMVWALLFGALIFHDKIELPMLIGAGLVIASGLYLLSHKIHSEKQIYDEPTITQL
jgi:drug/metabolite transporter (DMT)-like permease